MIFTYVLIVSDTDKSSESSISAVDVVAAAASPSRPRVYPTAGEILSCLMIF